MDGDAEAEARVQPRRIALHRRVDQPRDVGEINDPIELPIDVAPRQAEQAAAEVHVLAAGQLRMEPGAQLDQRHHATGHAHTPVGRPGDARNELQQRSLAGAVAADDADAGGLGHVEADVAQRPDRRVDAPARDAVNVLRLAAPPER